MSKQKKKKPSAEARMKLLEAQNRKEFKQGLARVCTLLGDGSVCSMFTGELFDMMFDTRGAAPKVKAEPGHEVPPDISNVVKKSLNSLMKDMMKPIYEDGPKISATDFCLILLPLQMFWTTGDRQERYKNRPEFAQLMKILPDEDTMADLMGQFMMEISYHADVYIFFYKCFSEGTYVGRADIVSDDRTQLMMQVIIYVSFHPPEWRTFGSGDKQRAAVRLACSRGGKLFKISLEPSKLGLRRKERVAVYIQQHALNRLRERIACKYPRASEFEMMIAFIVPTVIRRGGGTYLVEFRTSNLKAGYFLCELVEDVLLIRTFLFLTHDGTPEGKRLSETTGLSKFDQKYLKFDNLLTLANSDILSNEEVMDIFRKAGCDSLLKLCPVIRRMSSMWAISDTEIPLAEKLLYYLNTNRNDSWSDLLRAENSGTSSLPEGFEFPPDIPDDSDEREEEETTDIRSFDIEEKLSATAEELRIKNDDMCIP